MEIGAVAPAVGFRVRASLIEFSITSNWTAKVEYLHVDLSEEKYVALPQLDPTPRTHDVNIDTVRVGLNYRFGGPIAARY